MEERALRLKDSHFRKSFYLYSMQIRILRETVLPAIPSGSGIEADNAFLYLVGDDFNHVAQLDKNLAIIDQIEVYEADGDDWDKKSPNRLKKRKKADLEATTWLEVNRKQHLLLLGSGSGSTSEKDADEREANRTRGFLIPVSDQHRMGKAEEIDVESLYERLRADDAIEDLNIEAAAALPAGLLLINRGGLAQENTLIWVKNILDEETPFRTYPIETPPIGGLASGISGASYLPTHDALLLSLSAEDTENTVDDGKVHGSGLGLIYHVSQRLQSGQWALDDFALIRTTIPHKIESVAVTAISPTGALQVIAVADNDDGQSTLFTMEISLNLPQR